MLAFIGRGFLGLALYEHAKAARRGN